MAEEKAEENHDAPKKKGKGKLIIIIVVVLLLVGGGVGGFLMMGSKKADKDAASEEEIHQEEEDKHYAIGELAPFVVNLSQASAFIKVTIKFQYDPEVLDKVGHGGEAEHGSGGGGDGKAALHPKFVEKEALIRDAVIRVLSSKRIEEVLTLEGKDQLKEEILDAMNEALGAEEPAVVQILFTDFIIQ